MTDTLIFAIPKGRILDDAIPMLAAVGITPEPAFFDKSNRALTFATNRDDVRIIRVRAFDVATFVAHGAAHMGIVGSDVIDEFHYSELYAPVDLGIGPCRLSLAVPKGAPPLDLDAASHMRVATKYPAITRRFFASRGVQAECIKLNGAMEIAPALGLAPCIVDLVSSGQTLKDNGLIESAVLADVTARLIVNRAAFKLDHARVGPLVDGFRNLVREADNARAA
jgi:ATP phosphoribosyltransferase